MELSSIGIFHTIIGIVALISAIISYIKFGKIELSNLVGRVYFYGTVITSLSSLALVKHGTLNPGHIASLFIVFLLLVAFVLHYKLAQNKSARYFENFILSFTFFFSWVPTINETFTRMPAGHPLAQDISDPIIKNTLLLFFLLFIIGSVYQFLAQRKANRLIES